VTGGTAARRYGLAAAAGYLLVAAVLGARLLAAGSWRTELSPLYAVLRPQFSPWGLLAVPLLALLLLFLPRILRAPPAAFLPGAVLFGAALALAINACWSGLAELPVRAIEIFLRDLRTLGDSPAFFPAYHERITELSDHGHVRPPGLFLFLWAFTKVVGRNAYAWQILLALLGAAAAIPIYGLAKVFADRRAAAVAALLYLLSAAYVLHGVSYDGMFAALGATATYFIMTAARSGRWRAVIGAGITLAVGFFFSFTLAYLPVLGGALVLYYGLREKRLGRLLLQGAVALAIPAAALALLYVATGYDYVANFRESYRWAQTQASGGMNVFKLLLGAELPEGYPTPSYRRSYWLWVPGNLYAFFVYAGVPTAVLYGWWARDLFRRGAWGRPLNAALGTALVAFLAFNFTGVTLGETERIWLYLLPIVVIPAAAKLIAAEAASGRRRLVPLTLAVVVLQTVAMRLSLWIPW